MGRVVIIGDKKYKSTDANTVLQSNTDEELHNHFYGKNSIDAKWTRHIADINEQLKNHTEYKAGRPRKHSEIEVSAPELGA